ncbi:outer membrane beta-barrel protein [Roseimarinus sediminis]|uniref:outer membrane beta-barrel protein n=1 Tax=Roseimarinus sediminis TaxID=1610899 RepID=UPI003D1A4F5A
MIRAIIVLLLLIPVVLAAQSPFGVSRQKFDKKEYFVGIHGGVMVPFTTYSGTPYDGIAQKRYLDQTGGMDFRMHLARVFSLNTSISYRRSGARFPGEKNHAYQSQYLAFSLTPEIHFRLFEPLRGVPPEVMFFAGPFVANNLKEHIVSNELDVLVPPALLQKWDYGLDAGVGLRIPTYSFTGQSYLTIKLAYYYGVASTFPASEEFEGYTGSQLLLSESGERFNRGIRLTLSYELSLAKKKHTTFTAGGDGKRTYKKILVQ